MTVKNQKRTFYYIKGTCVVRAGLEPDTVLDGLDNLYSFSHPNVYGSWCLKDSDTVPHYVHLTIYPTLRLLVSGF